MVSPMLETPELYYFMQRLQNTPIQILEYSLTSKESDVKSINPISIIKDLLYDFGLSFSEWNSIQIPINPNDSIQENYLRTLLIFVYLLNDPFFKSRSIRFLKLKDLLFQKVRSYSNIIKSRDWIYDLERREETIRITLQALDLRLKNESFNQSQDRLLSIDSIEREKMISETRKAQARAKELRERLERQEAEEAASKYNRE
jgi:hypothetical protein